MGQAAAIGALIGGGLGLGKANEETELASSDAELAAKQTALSPYLSYGGVQQGMLGTLPQRGPTQYDRLVQGALSGAQFGQQFKGAGASSGSGMNPYGSSQPSGTAF